MGKRLRLKGVIKDSKSEKTVVVEISRKVMHPRYKKYVNRTNKMQVHAEEPYEIGTKVVIEETRPISKSKRWRVVDVIKEVKV